MKKNMFIRDVIRRKNRIGKAFFDFFLGIASYPRLVLEVFIRKNFGVRYFSGNAIIVGLILLFLPMVGEKLTGLFFSYSNIFHESSGNFWMRHLTWYLFTALYTGFAMRRLNEIQTSPSVFDFGKYSLYAGDIHPLFRNIPLIGAVNIRDIETIYEPLFFLIIGAILTYFGQGIGLVLVICSFIYGLSYMAAYRNGDDFVMDKIDEIIMNEEMEAAFVEDLIGEKTRGVRFHLTKPSSKEMRRKLGESFIEEDNVNTVTFAQ